MQGSTAEQRHLESPKSSFTFKYYNSQHALRRHVDFYVMDSSPDAAVIDYTRQKDIESQEAVSYKTLHI